MFTPEHKVNTVSKTRPDTTLELEEAAAYHQSIAGVPLSFDHLKFVEEEAENFTPLSKINHLLT